MKVRDNELKLMVDVLQSRCLRRSCYWPRQNPGSFTQGRGYSNPTKDWVCGTRQIHGCPTKSELEESDL